MNYEKEYQEEVKILNDIYYKRMQYKLILDGLVLSMI